MSAIAYAYQPQVQPQVQLRTRVKVQPQLAFLPKVQLQIQQAYQFLKAQWVAFLYQLDHAIRTVLGIQVAVHPLHITQVTRTITFMISLSLYSFVFSWTVTSQIMILQLVAGMTAYAGATYYYPQTQLPIFLPMVGTYLTHDYHNEKDREDVWLNNFLPLVRLLINLVLLYAVWSLHLFSSSIPLILACLKTLFHTIPIASHPFTGPSILLPDELMIKWTQSHPQRSLVLRFMHLLSLSLSLRLLYLILTN